MKKLLITLGCSLTYGEGTDAPSEKGWPPRLCKKLGFDKLINISGRGWSTSGIIKQMVESLNFKDYSDYEVYVIFFLPDPTRISFYWDLEHIQHFPLSDISDETSFHLFNTEPEVGALKEQLFYIKILEQICENQNWNVSLLHSNHDIGKELIKLYPSDSWINNDYHVLSWDDYVGQHKEHTAPRNHPNEKGYESVSNRILKLIHNRYPQLQYLSEVEVIDSYHIKHDI